MNPKRATDHELYTELEDLITERSIYGRGRTPEAAHYRSFANPEIRALRRELNQRGLPSRRWQYDATQEAADVADLHDTQREAIR